MITKHDLATALIKLGWSEYGTVQQGAFDLWVRDNDPDKCVRIPKNEDAPDYQRCLRRAVIDLAEIEQEQPEAWLGRINTQQHEYAAQVFVVGRWTYFLRRDGASSGVLTVACPHAAMWFKTEEEAEEHAATTEHPTRLVVRTVQQPELVDPSKEVDE